VRCAWCVPRSGPLAVPPTCAATPRPKGDCQPARRTGPRRRHARRDPDPPCPRGPSQRTRCDGAPSHRSQPVESHTTGRCPVPPHTVRTPILVNAPVRSLALRLAKDGTRAAT
jgi:hypothetical protein